MIPTHEEIPTHVIDAALTLMNHAIMHGWGGPTGDGPWSVHGIGSVKAHQQRLRELDAEREDHVKAVTQRDAAWKTLKEIRQLFVDDESFGATVDELFSKPLEDCEEKLAESERRLATCREALEIARVGMCAVGVTHPAERDVLNDAHDHVTRTLEATKPQ